MSSMHEQVKQQFQIVWSNRTWFPRRRPHQHLSTETYPRGTCSPDCVDQRKPEGTPLVAVLVWLEVPLAVEEGPLPALGILAARQPFRQRHSLRVNWIYTWQTTGKSSRVCLFTRCAPQTLECAGCVEGILPATFLSKLCVFVVLSPSHLSLRSAFSCTYAKWLPPSETSRFAPTSPWCFGTTTKQLRTLLLDSQTARVFNAKAQLKYHQDSEVRCNSIPKALIKLLKSSDPGSLPQPSSWNGAGCFKPPLPFSCKLVETTRDPSIDP